MPSNEPPSIRAIFKFSLPLMGIFMLSVLLWEPNRSFGQYRLYFLSRCT